MLIQAADLTNKAKDNKTVLFLFVMSGVITVLLCVYETIVGFGDEIMEALQGLWNEKYLELSDFTVISDTNWLRLKEKAREDDYNE